MRKKKVLVASTPNGRNIAQRALAGKYDLKFVSTIEEARRVLAGSEVNGEGSLFDLVVCGVHFDDSRMFELLQHIRTVDHYEELPFLVITAQQSVLPIEGAVKKGAELLGAYGFLNLYGLPEQEADRQLRHAVEQGFDRPVKVERMV